MWPCKSRADVVMMAAVLICAGSAGAEPTRLDLVWVDPTAMTGGAYDAMASESRAALASLGADVTWREAAPGEVLGPESLAVIAIPSHVSSSPERHVMGETHAVRAVAHAVWVFPDQVAWALGLDLRMRSSWGKLTERNFARALARVASHEVLHTLGLPHARGGLMSAGLDRRALTAPSLRIDRATLAAARRALDRGTLTALRESPSPAPGSGATVVLTPDLLGSPGPVR
jgi:hypothetical protein